jgi:hypothetical protein
MITDPHNRYRTPFEDIQPIKYAAWCQKARAMAEYHLERYMRETMGEPECLQHHRLRLPQSQCQGKKPYGSWVLANDSLMRRKGRNGQLGRVEDLSQIRVYHCEHCGMWHLGHRPNT